MALPLTSLLHPVEISGTGSEKVDIAARSTFSVFNFPFLRFYSPPPDLSVANQWELSTQWQALSENSDPGRKRNEKDRKSLESGMRKKSVWTLETLDLFLEFWILGKKLGSFVTFPYFLAKCTSFS